MSGEKAPPASTITVLDVLRLLRGGKIAFSRQHGTQHRCPSCAADPMSTALVNLVYSFELCSCGTPSYEHLIEQMWHRACFARRVLIDGEPTP